MVDFTNFSTQSTRDAARTNAGLRQYMISIYNYMAVALAITGIVAFTAANSENFIRALYNVSATGASYSLFGWIIALAPLAIVYFLSTRINTLDASTAKMLFWGYSVLIGLSMSSIFLVFTGESIARAFLITSSTFGSASLYGYVTRKDLTSMGSFLFMGVIGIIIASLLNIFLASSALAFAVSIISVIIFTGLTAYDTQKLKRIYFANENSNQTELGKIAIMGALNLYIDFVNIFMSLLHLLGNRR